MIRTHRHEHDASELYNSPLRRLLTDSPTAFHAKLVLRNCGLSVITPVNHRGRLAVPSWRVAGGASGGLRRVAPGPAVPTHPPTQPAGLPTHPPTGAGRKERNAIAQLCTPHLTGCAFTCPLWCCDFMMCKSCPMWKRLLGCLRPAPGIALDTKRTKVRLYLQRLQARFSPGRLSHRPPTRDLLRHARPSGSARSREGHGRRIHEAGVRAARDAPGLRTLR